MENSKPHDKTVGADVAAASAPNRSPLHRLQSNGTEGWGRDLSLKLPATPVSHGGRKSEPAATHVGGEPEQQQLVHTAEDGPPNTTAPNFPDHRGIIKRKEQGDLPSPILRSVSVASSDIEARPPKCSRAEQQRQTVARRMLEDAWVKKRLDDVEERHREETVRRVAAHMEELKHCRMKAEDEAKVAVKELQAENDGLRRTVAEKECLLDALTSTLALKDEILAEEVSRVEEKEGELQAMGQKHAELRDQMERSSALLRSKEAECLRLLSAKMEAEASLGSTLTILRGKEAELAAMKTELTEALVQNTNLEAALADGFTKQEGRETEAEALLNGMKERVSQLELNLNYERRMRAEEAEGYLKLREDNASVEERLSVMGGEMDQLQKRLSALQMEHLACAAVHKEPPEWLEEKRMLEASVERTRLDLAEALGRATGLEAGLGELQRRRMSEAEERSSVEGWVKDLQKHYLAQKMELNNTKDELAWALAEVTGVKAELARVRAELAWRRSQKDQQERSWRGTSSHVIQARFGSLSTFRQHLAAHQVREGSEWSEVNSAIGV